MGKALVSVMSVLQLNQEIQLITERNIKKDRTSQQWLTIIHGKIAKKEANLTISPICNVLINSKVMYLYY